MGITLVVIFFTILFICIFPGHHDAQQAKEQNKIVEISTDMLEVSFEKAILVSSLYLALYNSVVILQHKLNPIQQATNSEEKKNHE